MKEVSIEDDISTEVLFLLSTNNTYKWFLFHHIVIEGKK